MLSFQVFCCGLSIGVSDKGNDDCSKSKIHFQPRNDDCSWSKRPVIPRNYDYSQSKGHFQPTNYDNWQSKRPIQPTNYDCSLRVKDLCGIHITANDCIGLLSLWSMSQMALYNDIFNQASTAINCKNCRQTIDCNLDSQLIHDPLPHRPSPPSG